MGSNDCARIEADLVLLLDGGLDALRVEAVNAHFGQCPRCARFYRDLRAALVDVAPLDDAAADALGGFVFPDAAGGPPTDFPALTARMEAADLRGLGTLLYEILKAEFLYDYGDNVEAEAEPIADPAAERRRGAELVEDLRDWVDGDRVSDVDLRDVAGRFALSGVDMDRLERLIDGMRAVAQYNPALANKGRYYAALAHIKARRADPALEALAPLASGDEPGLARLARISMAVIPGMLQGDLQTSIAGLERCLVGDTLDPLVHLNLAQARFEAAGDRLTEVVRAHVDAARRVAPELVARHLGLPSARRLRLALAAESPGRH